MPGVDAVIYNSYSQHGEDIIIDAIFRVLKIDKPSYLDLGAHHPRDISNTYLFYLRGSRGVNVEANGMLLPAFNEMRPLDFNLWAGVATKPGTQKFYVYDEESACNTFSEAEVLRTGFTVRKVVDVDCMTLNYIVRKFCGSQFPDFLNVDLEGLDYDILAAADFTESRPKVICVESGHDVSHAEMTKMMRWQGFEPYAAAGGNVIYLDSQSYRNIKEWMGC